MSLVENISIFVQQTDFYALYFNSYYKKSVSRYCSCKQTFTEILQKIKTEKEIKEKNCFEFLLGKKLRQSRLTHSV